MEYVKTHLTTIVKFPYTFNNLQEENPSTNYDNRFTLPEWYAQTEDAITNNYTVEIVTEDSIPTIDPNTQMLEIMTVPINVAGNWTIGWNIIEKTAEQIQKAQEALDSDPTVK